LLGEPGSIYLIVFFFALLRVVNIEQGNETKMVEAALVKIASLTKVALGNAGMDILSVNLKGAEFNRMFGTLLL
jgi:hypothetical protein